MRLLSVLNHSREPACVIVKHASPCGVAIGDSIHTAYDNAFKLTQRLLLVALSRLTVN